MCSSQLRTSHPTKSSDSLSLHPVPQGSRGSIRFVRQRSPQRATNTRRCLQHQNLFFLRDGVTRVLRALWFDIVLVKISRRICRLGFDRTGHARHALQTTKAKTRLCRLRSRLVHAIRIMLPGRLTAMGRSSPLTTDRKRPEAVIKKKRSLYRSQRNRHVDVQIFEAMYERRTKGTTSAIDNAHRVRPVKCRTELPDRLYARRCRS